MEFSPLADELAAAEQADLVVSYHRWGPLRGVLEVTPLVQMLLSAVYAPSA